MTDQKTELVSQPTKRPGGRNQRITTSVKNATLSLLLEKGAFKVSLEEIAERAGVNRATLYRRWRTKQKLITWSMLEVMSESVVYPDTGSIVEDLVELGRALNQFLDSPLAPTFFQIIAVDSHQEEELDMAVKEFWNERLSASHVIINRAIERGEISPDVDKELLIESIYGPFYFRRLASRTSVDEHYLRLLVERAVSGDLL